MIGVDPSSNEILALSSHPQQALSITDLVNVIASALQRSNLRVDV